MAQADVLARVKEALGELVLDVQWEKTNQAFIRIPADRVIDACRIVMEQPGARYAISTGIDTRDAVEVLYHFCLDPEHYTVTLKAAAPKPFPEIDSVTSVVPAAEWIEREMMDLLGIKFTKHPRPERLILADSWPEGVYPLRRDYRHES